MINASVDLTDFYLETERLIIRPFRMEDLSDFNAYARVPGVGEWAGWPHHESLEESRRILLCFIEVKKTLALVYKATGQVIGSLGLENYRKNMENVGFPPEATGREIGYVLSKDYWGHGLMSEAVKAVIASGFTNLHYDFFTCSHWVENLRSRRVIEKCGFTFVQNGECKTLLGEVRKTMDYIIFRTSRV